MSSPGAFLIAGSDKMGPRTAAWSRSVASYCSRPAPTSHVELDDLGATATLLAEGIGVRFDNLLRGHVVPLLRYLCDAATPMAAVIVRALFTERVASICALSGDTRWGAYTARWTQSPEAPNLLIRRLPNRRQRTPGR